MAQESQSAGATEVAPKTVLDLFRLDGRRALVTGGAKGLGRVIAQALAEAGAEVAVASRTLLDCHDAADAIAASTRKKTAAIQADVTNAADVDRLVDQAQQELGPIDILVNNAGIN